MTTTVFMVDLVIPISQPNKAKIKMIMVNLSFKPPKIKLFKDLQHKKWPEKTSQAKYQNQLQY